MRKEPKEYELHEGISVQHWYPASVIFPLTENRGLELTDSVPNTLNLIIVSERLKRFLEANAGARMEFLPVQLRDQKGRLVPEPYFILNLLEVVECVDLEKSQFERSAIIPSFIAWFSLLVVDPARIPPEAKLFRLKEKPNLILIREDLAQVLVNEDYTGMMFLELEEYGREWGRT
ncbi:hypothetical protein D7Y13_20315 [Corallococcus praedator]|uniref:Immunity MXAN-0049 protein domain-containing protein n=1 Tax=Corallococcus praedator TaxID=2316724 RepID=A0ABX9QFA1_9BACT|nr:DUF1629 domain-containing protein [Corallococcus praedator]RKH26648.1 hypothetical protein D7X75_27950 [Corallococcus sp. CA031C]RKI06383.1 hypothetical protein D7Y13_20315 [Corallococcus praedator]